MNESTENHEWGVEDASSQSQQLVQGWNKEILMGEDHIGNNNEEVVEIEDVGEDIENEEDFND